jgi:protein tyrosine phosphatase (PTP) superfamily phosphohydrolase (DUF442 family)
MDYNFINNRVATGAAISSTKDVDALVAAGITHIINCRKEFDDKPLLVNHPQIGYLFNGVHDDGKKKLVSWFQPSIEFALAALAQPHNKVYAHCAAGINRGPSTAFAILRALGMNYDDAKAAIRRVRPKATVNYRHDADDAVKALGYD